MGIIAIYDNILITNKQNEKIETNPCQIITSQETKKQRESKFNTNHINKET